VLVGTALRLLGFVEFLQHVAEHLHILVVVSGVVLPAMHEQDHDNAFRIV